jgi:hypothetical protein
MQDALASILKAGHPKGCTFECFGSVVYAFGESVGVRAVEGIEDVFLPALEHLQARIDLWKL